MALEQCGNCGRTIGKLETAHVYRDNVVCAECFKRLAPPPLPAPVSAAPGSGAAMSPAPPTIPMAYAAAPAPSGRKNVGCLAGSLIITGATVLMCCVASSFSNKKPPASGSPAAPAASAVPQSTGLGTRRATMPGPLFGDDPALVAMLGMFPPDDVRDVSNNGHFVRKDAVYRDAGLYVAIVPDYTYDPPRRWRVNGAMDSATGRRLDSFETALRVKAKSKP